MNVKLDSYNLCTSEERYADVDTEDNYLNKRQAFSRRVTQRISTFLEDQGLPGFIAGQTLWFGIIMCKKAFCKSFYLDQNK